MENQSNNIKIGESIKLIGRRECFIEGVYEVINTNENEFCCKMDGEKLTIKGNNIHINKLDLDKKYVQITGDINEIKYSKNIVNKFKRFFK